MTVSTFFARLCGRGKSSSKKNNDKNGRRTARAAPSDTQKATGRFVAQYDVLKQQQQLTAADDFGELHMSTPAVVLLHLKLGKNNPPVEQAVVVDVVRSPVQLQSVPSLPPQKRVISNAVGMMCAALMTCALYGDYKAKRALWARIEAAHAAAALAAKAAADFDAARRALLNELVVRVVLRMELARIDSVAKVHAILLKLALFPLCPVQKS
jgi:hypothetical protein